MVVSQTVEGSSFLCSRLADKFGNNITIWWRYVLIVVLYRLCYFKPKLLVERDGIVVVCLNMQVYLGDVLLCTEIKNMVQQLRSCQNRINEL
jgi:hypothetical protein